MWPTHVMVKYSFKRKSPTLVSNSFCHVKFDQIKYALLLGVQEHTKITVHTLNLKYRFGSFSVEQGEKNK